MAGNDDTYAVERREVLGKKVKRLRRDGVLPGNIYGRGLDSLAVQLPAGRASAMLAEHGTNSLLRVQVDGEPDPRPVMVRAVKRDPVTSVIQHLDFYQVDLARRTTVSVPVHVVGEAPAVHTFEGVLLHGADTVPVQALPADVPAFLEVSVEGLVELEQQVTVADLEAPESVVILADREVMLARVARPRLIVEEVEELLEGEEEALPEEGEEGEEAADGAEGAADAEQGAAPDRERRR